ncbi:MAG: hypothetical protein QF724_09565 [Planctomycetota bacterium]|jgi:hypothetical protein|nr:hypothetical protein [Planctomycetota bacterium]MDP6839171.1 hypothetical protein [Planctomycetota bacterium]
MTAAADTAGRAKGNPEQGLALGLVAMAPLLVVGEVAAIQAAESGRSAAQALLFLGLEPLGSAGDWLRRFALCAVIVAAAWRLHRQAIPLVPGVMRRLGEGVLGALALGPLLLGLGPGLGWLFRVLGSGGEVGDGAFAPLAGRLGASAMAGPAPSLATGALVAAAGAWEEILCRVLLYGLLMLAVRRSALLLRCPSSVATWAGEILGLAGSALLFAALHLESVLAHFSGLIGSGGEPFEAAIFTWRLSAGILLGLLFRWRGPGVAAWTHALFNLGLLLGAGPGVLL